MDEWMGNRCALSAVDDAFYDVVIGRHGRIGTNEHGLLCVREAPTDCFACAYEFITGAPQ